MSNSDVWTSGAKVSKKMVVNSQGESTSYKHCIWQIYKWEIMFYSKPQKCCFQCFCCFTISWIFFFKLCYFVFVFLFKKKFSTVMSRIFTNISKQELSECSVQLLSHVRLFATPWTAACQASLSITNSQSLLKLMSIELVMPSNHLILCRPLLLLPSIFHSIKVFSNESVLCIRWPKYWSFSFSISPSNEYSGLISSRMDWLGLSEVQGTLKSLLQQTFKYSCR